MRVTIVGTGYVGLTTGVCLASVGHQVTCVDVLPERVAAIQGGKAPFYEPGLAEMLGVALSQGRLRATTRLQEAVAGSEVTFLTVGTPQTDQGIDLSHVAAAAKEIGTALRRAPGYRVVVVKSTVVPGTTGTLVRSILEESSGRRAGEFGLSVNPEFLREGSAIHDFMHPDRIVIGQWDEKSGQVLAEIYRSFDCPKIFTTPANAEMMKYASNALLATLISFSNEIAALCEVTPSADARVVLQGVHLDRRLSPVVQGQRISPGILSFLWAGCGFGGSCLPKDVNALRAYARERKLTPHVLDAVVTVNTERPAHLERLAEGVLGSLRGATVAVLGLAFKPGTDDLRESAALAVIRLLRNKGAAVKAFDPIVTSAPDGSGLGSLATVCATPEDALRGADAAMIVTACPEFLALDWPALCKQMRQPIIIDGRNALDGVSWPEGVRYFGIGKPPENGRG
jgi:UDPglucose 6-dehydrogenase/GDP-mannose 6-dehydrogenase